MHLALVPRRRIVALYGPAAPSTLVALDGALDARAAAGFPTRAFDPEDGLPELGVPPAPLTAPALVAQLAATSAALVTRGDHLESLWIVGGPQVVPFATLPNPMPDRDGPLLGDGPYALATPAEPLARWPVGRTPDTAPPHPGLLAAQLNHVAAAHAAGPRPAGHALAISAARWAAVSAAVIAGAAGAELLLSPPFRTRRPTIQRLGAARLLYCNLHGVRADDAWFGQAPADTALVPALTPADVGTLRLDDAVVVTQACFGARLTPAGAGLALAPALLLAGARGLYGALGLTYGAPNPPPGESDVLAGALLHALRTPGARLGPALVAAQIAMLSEVLRLQGAPDPDDLKTLLGFLLYGDPLLPA